MWDLFYGWCWDPLPWGWFLSSCTTKANSSKLTLEGILGWSGFVTWTLPLQLSLQLTELKFCCLFSLTDKHLVFGLDFKVKNVAVSGLAVQTTLSKSCGPQRLWRGKKFLLLPKLQLSKALGEGVPDASQIIQCLDVCSAPRLLQLWKSGRLQSVRHRPSRGCMCYLACWMPASSGTCQQRMPDAKCVERRVCVLGGNGHWGLTRWATFCFLRMLQLSQLSPKDMVIGYSSTVFSQWGKQNVPNSRNFSKWAFEYPTGWTDSDAHGWGFDHLQVGFTLPFLGRLWRASLGCVQSC